MSVRATRGSHSRFCSSVPNMRSGSATPIDWCADDERAERAVPGADHRQRAVVVDLREPEAVVLLGDLHAHRADALEALDRPRRGSWSRARSAAGRPRPRGTSRNVARKRSPFSIASASSRGCGWIRSSRKLPRKSSLPKLGSFHSCSRAASATCRASRSLTSVVAMTLITRATPVRRVTAFVCRTCVACFRRTRSLLLLVLAAPARAAGPQIGIADDRDPARRRAGGRHGGRGLAAARHPAGAHLRAVVADRAGRAAGRRRTTGRSSTTPSTASSPPAWSRCSRSPVPGRCGRAGAPSAATRAMTRTRRTSPRSRARSPSATATAWTATSLWNEPNLGAWLRPQAACFGKVCTSVAPHLYRDARPRRLPGDPRRRPGRQVLIGAMSSRGSDLQQRELDASAARVPARARLRGRAASRRSATGAARASSPRRATASRSTRTAS